MTYRVQIAMEAAEVGASERRRLHRLARWVLANEGAEPCEVGILLTDDEGIRALNRRFLGEDRPTDVLAFSLLERGEDPSPFVVSQEGLTYLGDVVISQERAREQAASLDHPPSREVELLLVHGLLHLLGYDDEEEVSRRRMTARQERVLASFTAGRSLAGGFGAAFAGMANLLRTQRNFRIHILLGALAVALAAWLRLALSEWAILVLAVALVLVSEGLNTALEAVVDLVSPERRTLARRAKDLSATAVLLAAIAALVVGALLFLPRLWELLR